MGIYVNPGKERFIEAISSDIYVDKTELIKYTNSVLLKWDKSADTAIQQIRD